MSAQTESTTTKKKAVMLCLSPELDVILDDLARKFGESRSVVARLAISAFAKQSEKQEAA